MEQILKEEEQLLKDLPVMSFFVSIESKKIISNNSFIDNFVGYKVNNILFSDIFKSNENDYLFKEITENNTPQKRLYHLENGKFILLYAKKYNKSLIIFLGIDLLDAKKERDNIIAQKDIELEISKKESVLLFLDECILNAKQKYFNFSIAYIVIDNEQAILEEDIKEYIKFIVSIIKKSIRNTDMIGMLTKTEYIIIFPNCPIQIMNEVLNTIEKKFKFLNLTSNIHNPFKMEYETLFYNGKKHFNSYQIIDKLKNNLKEKKALK